MNISWQDFNRVQEAGNFSFRDGTITVTVADLSIFRTNPNAIFQLMRKNPLQGAPEYVLGRVVNLQGYDGELIYESSNGDKWSLTMNPETSFRAVKHEPNQQSGGRVSYIEIDKFLSEGSNGPEHQALRRLIENIPARPPY